MPSCVHSILLAAKRAEFCAQDFAIQSMWGTCKWGHSAPQKRLSAAIRQQLQGQDPAPGEVSGKTVGTRLGLRLIGWNEGSAWERSQSELQHVHILFAPGFSWLSLNHSSFQRCNIVNKVISQKGQSLLRAQEKWNSLTQGDLTAVNESWGQAGGRWIRLCSGRRGEDSRRGGAVTAAGQWRGLGRGRCAEWAPSSLGEETGRELQESHVRPWRWNENWTLM